MKTGDLIAALVADNQPQNQSQAQASAQLRLLSGKLLIAAAAGTALAAIGFLIKLGVRADFGLVLTTWRFDAKLAFVGLAAALALAECIRLCRPTAKTVFLPIMAAAGLLGLAVLAELLLVPSEAWRARLVGQNAFVCLTAIPLLAIAPMLALLHAMRAGAPASPSKAGAMAGFAAGSIAASLYALHCPDDSPLFVAVWYGICLLLLTLVGALLGRRLLRW